MKKLIIMFFLVMVTGAKGQTSIFPIFGDEARELGYDLPKPYGLNVLYMSMDQDVKVNSIDLNFGNPFLAGIMDNYINLDVNHASVKVENVSLKGDLWVLPFLNVYAVLGHTKGNTKANVDVGIDMGWPFKPVTIEGVDLDFDYEGTTYGGGMILAGGYENYFALIDVNYTYTTLDIIDGEMKALIVTPRVGYMMEIMGKPLKIWVGGMYQNITQTLKGDLGEILDIDIDAKFEVDQKSKDAWNYTSGAHLELSKSLELMFEVGYGKKSFVMGGLGYRF